MFIRLAYIFLILQIISCSTPEYKEPHIKIETNFGDIIIELYPEKAPKTVAAFLSYIDKGYYRNSSFYRVLKKENQPSSSFKSELIQGGIWQTNNKLAAGLPGIPHEPTNQTGILHTNGTISLARTTPGSASSEFFICVGDQPAYNYGGEGNPDGQGYAAFGRVVKGMNFVKQIHDQPGEDESFDKHIAISNITIL